MRWSIILAIAAAHFLAGFVALLISFGGSMSRFDSPSPSPPSLSERIMETLTTVLYFPIVTFWPFPAPGMFGYLVFALNSILWAVCIYAVRGFCYREFVEYDAAYHALQRLSAVRSSVAGVREGAVRSARAAKAIAELDVISAPHPHLR